MTYVQVGVGAIVENEQGQVFLSLRGPAAHNEQGYWEFPGGAVEFGESLHVAIQREFEEEYGMGVEAGTLVGVYEQFIDGEHWISVLFQARHVTGTPEIREPDKCSAIGWYAVGDMPTPLTQNTTHGLASFLEKLN